MRRKNVSLFSAAVRNGIRFKKLGWIIVGPPFDVDRQYVHLLVASAFDEDLDITITGHAEDLAGTSLESDGTAVFETLLFHVEDAVKDAHIVDLVRGGKLSNPHRAAKVADPVAGSLGLLAFSV
jgi:hypothetical protein